MPEPSVLDHKPTAESQRIVTTDQVGSVQFQKCVIGDATLYCGDSRELLRAGVFGGIGAIVSDPPYGIGYQHGGSCRGAFGGKQIQSNSQKIIGDDEDFDPSCWVNNAPLPRIEKPLSAGLHGHKKIILWGAENYMQLLPKGGTMLAWDKNLGRAGDDSFADCEWAWCGRKVKREVFRWVWKGVVKQRSRLDINTIPNYDPKSGKSFPRLHVSQKPVELMRWCIEKVKPIEGLPILDPYMGSGTTGVAALSLGHSFIGCEISPEFFEIACRRIELFYERGGAA